MPRFNSHRYPPEDKAEQYYRSCGKRKHASKRQANAHMRSLLERSGDYYKDPARLGVYRCPYCRYWHVGHSARSKSENSNKKTK